MKSAGGAGSKDKRARSKITSDVEEDTPVPELPPASVPLGKESKANAPAATNNNGAMSVPLQEILQGANASRIASASAAPAPAGGKPPSRAEEFEKFKRDQGAELNKNLNENKRKCSS